MRILDAIWANVNTDIICGGRSSVYEDLRKLLAARMAQENRSQTLQQRRWFKRLTYGW